VAGQVVSGTQQEQVIRRTSWIERAREPHIGEHLARFKPNPDESTTLGRRAGVKESKDSAVYSRRKRPRGRAGTRYKRRGRGRLKVIEPIGMRPPGHGQRPAQNGEVRERVFPLHLHGISLEKEDR